MVKHKVYQQTTANAASELHKAVFLHSRNPTKLLSLAEQKQKPAKLTGQR